MGDPQHVPNYHPVSLTWVVSNVFERLLSTAILSSLNQCKALVGCEHGFQPHRSCHSYFLILEDTMTQLMDDGNTTDVVYLYVAKIFYLVNHRLLLAMLKSFGLCEIVEQYAA